MSIEVLHKGKIDVTCKGCGSNLRADHDDFEYLHTNPPMWRITCPVCNCRFKCSPPELITAVVSNMNAYDIALTMDRTVEKMTGRTSVGFVTKQIDHDFNKKERMFDHYGRPIV